MEKPLDFRGWEWMGAWYSSLICEETNILESLCGGKGRFLVSGDGLLLRVAERRWSHFSEEPQTLLLLHGFEHMLSDLADRSGFLDTNSKPAFIRLQNQSNDYPEKGSPTDCKENFTEGNIFFETDKLVNEISHCFIVVFFEEFVNLVIESGAFGQAISMACQLVRLHCLGNGIPVRTFNNWWGPEWSRFILECNPSFLLAEDGAHWYLPRIAHQNFLIHTGSRDLGGKNNKFDDLDWGSGEQVINKRNSNSGPLRPQELLSQRMASSFLRSKQMQMMAAHNQQLAATAPDLLDCSLENVSAEICEMEQNSKVEYSYKETSGNIEYNGNVVHPLEAAMIAFSDRRMEIKRDRLILGVLQSIIFSCLVHQVHVVALYKLQIRGRKIFGFAIAPQLTPFTPKKPIRVLKYFIEYLRSCLLEDSSEPPRCEFNFDDESDDYIDEASNAVDNQLINTLENLSIKTTEKITNDNIEAGKSVFPGLHEIVYWITYFNSGAAGIRAFNIRGVLAALYCRSVYENASNVLRNGIKDTDNENYEEDISCSTLVTDSFANSQLSNNVAICTLVAKLLLIVDYFLRRLSLRERCHAGIKASSCAFIDEQISSALEFFYYFSANCFKNVLNDCQNIQNAKRFFSIVDMTQLADLFDFKYFITFFVISLNHAKDNNWQANDDFFGLKQDENEKLQQIWTLVANRRDSFYPVDFMCVPNSNFDLHDVVVLSNTLFEAIPLGNKEEITESCNTNKDSKIVTVQRIENEFLGLYLSLSNNSALSGIHDIKNKYSKSIYKSFTAQFNWLTAEKPESTDVACDLSYITNYTRDNNEDQSSDSDVKILHRRRDSDNYKSQLDSRDRHIHAKSLYGADNLHFPIVVSQTRHPWLKIQDNTDTKVSSKIRKDKEKKNDKEHNIVKKMGSKAELIVKKNEELALKKLKDMDTLKLKDMQKIITKLIGMTTPSEFISYLLEITAGRSRITDSYNDFPAINSILKTEEYQLKFFIMMIKSISETLAKNFTRSTITSENDQKNMQRLICLVFRLVYEVYRIYEKSIAGKEICVLQKMLLDLGFERSARNLFNGWKKYQDLYVPKDDTKSSKTSNKEKQGRNKVIVGKKDKEELTIKSSIEREKIDIDFESFRITHTNDIIDFAINDGMEEGYQLEYMGPDMERSTRSQSDPRVIFKPDAWQAQLLDIVDARESALVCAPTASGKTFICYYAMEQVLRKNNESVVVYVAPQKALINQVMAEIYARFSTKQYPVNCQSALTAAFYREYNSNRPLESQILVTLPFIFENLLMSCMQRSWVKKIEYVIFDEIHCIGHENEGSQWEHLIQIIPSPFLALSATVGNPKSFHEWMKRAHSIGGRKVHLIKHDERYSDLSLYIFLDNDLLSFNPVISLHYKQVLENGLSHDFYLTPTDALQFYLVLSEVLNNDDLLWLHPSFYFIGCGAISKKQYRFYLNTLLGKFLALVQVDKVIDSACFQRIVDGIISISACKNLYKRLKRINLLELENYFFKNKNKESKMLIDNSVVLSSNEENKLSKFMDYTSNISNQRNCYLDPDNFIKLFRVLENKQYLPALVFNYNREEIMQMTEAVVLKLQAGQMEKFYGTPEAEKMTKMENKRRQDAYNALIKQYELESKLSTLSRREREEQGIDADAMLQDTNELPPPPIDVAEEYDPEFNFADWRIMNIYSKDIERYIKRAATTKVSKIILAGLSRGIGAHSNGLPRKYRDAVELLFRLGFLRIVIATETLSLGINMPCRSVIFAGDSLQLTPLMFRQMSGRAGRRGFDLIGHVIFWDMPLFKIKRLVSSQLSVLMGEFPNSATMFLRSLHLHQKLMDPTLKYMCVMKNLLRIYEVPLFVVSPKNEIMSDDENKQLTLRIKYHFRFLVDMLYQLNFIDGKGKMFGLAYLVMLLLECEPANFIIAYLIVSGALHQSLTRIYDEEIRDLLLLKVLAKILYPRQVPFNLVVRHELSSGILKNVIKQRFSDFDKSCSPFIRSDTKSLDSFVKQYNSIVQETVINSVKAYCQNMDYNDRDFELPFSKLSFNYNSIDETIINSLDHSECLKYYKRQIIDYRCRSPFAALVGKSDSSFICAEDLCDSIRNSVYLTRDMIPDVEIDEIYLLPRDVDEHKCMSNLDEMKFVHVVLTNSYALDFWFHGDLKNLLPSNHIPTSKSWFVLRDFLTTLQLINKALPKFIRTVEDANVPSYDSIQQSVKSLYKRIKKGFERSSAT